MYIQIVERSISRTHFILNSWDSVCVCICSLYIQRTSICIQSEWVKSLSRVWLFATPWTVAIRLLCPWNSPGKNTGVACHSLLQGIFLTQGSNQGLSHCRQILHHLSHQGSPWQNKVLEIQIPPRFELSPMSQWLTVQFYVAIHFPNVSHWFSLIQWKNTEYYRIY